MSNIKACRRNIVWWRMLVGTIVVLAWSCTRDSVLLSIDLNTRTQWRYDMQVDVEGRYKQGDSLVPFSNKAFALLRASAVQGKQGQVSFKPDSIEFTSTVLSEAEQDNLVAQARASVFTLSYSQGTLVPVDTNMLPMVAIGGWDLYRSLIRLIPSLPGEPIRPGYSWERERQFPLQMSFGDATVHLFQNFIFDSLSTTSSTAWVSWRFTYKIEGHVAETSHLLDKIPLAGAGNGGACIDVTQKCLRSAQVTFMVPAGTQPEHPLSWTEKVSLTLKP